MGERWLAALVVVAIGGTYWQTARWMKSQPTINEGEAHRSSEVANPADFKSVAQSPGLKELGPLGKLYLGFTVVSIVATPIVVFLAIVHGGATATIALIGLAAIWILQFLLRSSAFAKR